MRTWSDVIATTATATVSGQIARGSFSRVLCTRVPAATMASSSSWHTDSGQGRRGRGRHNGRWDPQKQRRSSGVDDADRIDALGRLMTRILRHKATDLSLAMRTDGYVPVRQLLALDMKTFSGVPLRQHSINEIREAVRRDNKQRLSLLEEGDELLIRANQGHTITVVSTEDLLTPIVSAEEVPVCVHGTYRRNLDSILQSGLKRMSRLHVHFAKGLPSDGEVISGMRKDINLLIHLDVNKALEEGMKLYISDNGVVLTEGFDGAVPARFFKKIESWPGRNPIPFQT